MRQNFFLILTLASMLPALTFTQCKEVPKRELMMLDTLDTILVRTRENLSIDLITLNNRKERINQDRNLLMRFYRDTVDPELGQMMTRYRGIYKIYGRFIGNYQQVHNDLVTSKKQVETLRNSVRDHKLTKEQFKEYYNNEKEFALANFRRSKEISANIPEVEPDFQRISREVDALLLKVAETDTTLAGILRERE